MDSVTDPAAPVQASLTIEAPQGAKFLILEAPAEWEPMYRTDLSKLEAAIRRQIETAKENDAWPVILFMTAGWTARWLEAE